MKIGFYFPRKSEISKSFYDKSDNSLIEWDSDLGFDFILSLFNNKNLDLPLYNENHNFSFSSLEEFEEFISLVKSINTIENIEQKIISDWPDNIIPSLKKLEKLNVNNLLLKNQINELIESFSENLSTIQKELNLPLVQKAKKLANLRDDQIEILNSTSYLFHQMLNNFEQLEIPVFGFKLSNSHYSNFEFNQLIGYNYEERNTPYNQFECLNKFYKVIRTDDVNDVLWLMLERSTMGDSLKLVFRSDNIKKTNHYKHDKSEIKSKNDIVYHFDFIERENNLYLLVTNNKTSNNSNEEITFGMTEILDKNGNSLNCENEIRERLIKSIKKGDILEGWKINYNYLWTTEKKGNKIKIYGLEFNSSTYQCKSCKNSPCICQTILNWENFPHRDFSQYEIKNTDQNSTSSNFDLDYNYSYSSIDEFNLNWSKYNDQLDMDQQDPEFWSF